MSAFIQQLPALIGVVIGALGSYLAVVRGDRARFRRERTARWEERRLAVYADYARTLKQTVHLAEANVARDPAGEALILLGSKEVVNHARVWVTAGLGHRGAGDGAVPARGYPQSSGMA